MTTYREQLKDSVELTEKWNLQCLGLLRMTDWVNHDEKHGFTLNSNPEYWAEFSRALPQHPEIRANACAPVHIFAQSQIMLMGNEWAPVLTIGDISVDGQSCFNVSRSTMRRYFRNGPEKNAQINIHVWLTFADLTIFDLTIIPWLLRQHNEPMDLNRPDGLAVLGDPDELKPQYEYRPMLIGPEFLWKTGTLEPETKKIHTATEIKWAQILDSKSK